MDTGPMKFHENEDRGHSSWDEVKRRRVEQDGVTGNPYCQCDDHLSRRMTTRIAEAEDAAQRALAVMSTRLRDNGDKAETFELQRLAQVARGHVMLAEALRAVLDGGF